MVSNSFFVNVTTLRPLEFLEPFENKNFSGTVFYLVSRVDGDMCMES